MPFLSKHPTLNTLILTVFALAWLYTEVTEYYERQDVYEQYRKFHDQGARFTAKRGDALESRVIVIEKRLNIEATTGE